MAEAMPRHRGDSGHRAPASASIVIAVPRRSWKCQIADARRLARLLPPIREIAWRHHCRGLFQMPIAG